MKLTILVDGTNELINSLPGLEEPMDSWDSILSFCLIIFKFKEKHSLTEFLEFLDSRAQTSDTANSSLLASHQNKSEFKKPLKRNVFHVSVKEIQCKLCNENHPLYRCAKFRSLSVKARIQKAHDAKVCLKCLSHHDAKEICKFDKCPVCSKVHNRLLCYEDESRRNSEKKKESKSIEANVNHLMSDCKTTSLLGTVSCKVINTISDENIIRGMCDTGSQLNLITEQAVKQLKMPKTATRIKLNGVGGSSAGRALGIVTLKLNSLYNNKVLSAQFYVVQAITEAIPLKKIESDWIKGQDLCLADPNFDVPNKVDVLLGVSFYAQILLPAIKRFNTNLIAQESQLGWILFGTATDSKFAQKRKFISAVVTEQPVQEMLDCLKL